MSAVYFWVDNKVIKYNTHVFASEAKKLKLGNKYAVDTFCTCDEDKYGKFGSNGAGWYHVPFNTFPKEFRAWLLINT